MSIRARRIPIEFAGEFTLSEASLPVPEEESVTVTRLKAEILNDFLQSGLTKKQKCYIMLYYKHQMTMQQIADKYSVNKSTVSRTIKAARKKLNERVLKYYRKYI